MHYILDRNNNAVKVDDPCEWGEWWEKNNLRRIVKQETPAPGLMVSTVFLGLDHNFMQVGDPLLFETMVFGFEFDGETRRCSTWQQAVEMHDLVMKEVSQAIGSN